jgi:hypothetical protein
MTRPLTAHSVTEIHFPPGSNDGPCDCACGWSGQASEFSAHRKDGGGGYSKSVVGPRVYDPKVWNRQYPGRFV